jgi:hypothetical protein
MHRLWYDIRNQAMFEKSFQADVGEIDQSLERMIWRVMSRYAELAGGVIGVPEHVAYALFDGLFQQGLQRLLSGRDGAAAALQSAAEGLMDRLITAT